MSKKKPTLLGVITKLYNMSDMLEALGSELYVVSDDLHLKLSKLTKKVKKTNGR